jgi:hypothetical protein
MMPDTGRSGALDWKGHLLLLHSAESERVSALVMDDGCFTVRLGVRH